MRNNHQEHELTINRIAEEMSIEGNLAGKGKRFANLILDFIFLIIFLIGVSYLFVLIGLTKTIEDVNDYLFVIIIISIYYVSTEVLLGETIAKFITRTKVVTVSGSEPNILSIIVRTACRYIPFEPFSVLVNTIGWHDSISKTRVVND